MEVLGAFGVFIYSSWNWKHSPTTPKGFDVVWAVVFGVFLFQTDKKYEKCRLRELPRQVQSTPFSSLSTLCFSPYLPPLAILHDNAPRSIHVGSTGLLLLF